MNKKVLYGVPAAVIIAFTAYNLGGKDFFASLTPEQAETTPDSGNSQQTMEVGYPAEQVTRKLRRERNFWSTFEHPEFSSDFFGLSISEDAVNQTSWLITFNAKPLVEVSFDVISKGDNATTINSNITVTAESLSDKDRNLTSNKTAVIKKLVKLILTDGITAMMQGRQANFAALDGQFSLTESQILANIQGNLGLSDEEDEYDDEDLSDDFTGPALDTTPYNEDEEGSDELENTANEGVVDDSQLQENLGFDPEEVRAKAAADVAQDAAEGADEAAEKARASSGFGEPDPNN